MTVMLVDVYMFVFNLIADESSAQLLRNHKEMTKFYLEMYLNVNKINSSVSELMDTVLTMQKDLEKKISWFSHILGSSGKIFFLKLKVRWLSYEGSNYTIGIMNCYSFTDLSLKRSTFVLQCTVKFCSHCILDFNHNIVFFWKSLSFKQNYVNVCNEKDNEPKMFFKNA